MRSSIIGLPLLAAALSHASVPCQVSVVEVDISAVGQYTCDNSTTNTKIFYPTDDAKGPFPVVFFQHGKDGYNDGYDKWMESVAKQCLIVVAPATGPNTATKECLRDRDLILALKWIKMNPDSSPAKPDLSRIGAMGHSAGAHHLPLFVQDAKAAGYNVAASVLSHGGRDISKYSLPNIPSFFLSSKGDTTVPAHSSLDFFKQASSQHKVLATTLKGSHSEPHQLYQLAPWTGRFLACHLYPSNHPRRETCDFFYDESSGSQICNAMKDLLYTGDDATGEHCEGCVVNKP